MYDFRPLQLDRVGFSMVNDQGGGEWLGPDGVCVRESVCE